MAGGLAISTDQFKLVCLAGGALVMAVFVAGIAKSVFHMYFKRYSRLQQRRARKRKEVSDPNDGADEMYRMSSVATEKSTLRSSSNSNSLYSSWSPYVSPSEFSTTAPLQTLLDINGASYKKDRNTRDVQEGPPPYSQCTFPNRKLMFKCNVQYKIPHAKLDSEC